MLALIEASEDGCTSVELAAALGASLAAVRLVLAEFKAAGVVEGGGEYRDGAAIVRARRIPLQMDLLVTTPKKRPIQRERTLFGEEYRGRA
jgi:DNA-binding IclR family transcriptional regulator